MPQRGGGGAGGNYAKKVISVISGNTYTVTVGTGGVSPTPAINGGTNPGTPSWFGSTGTVYAEGGAGGFSIVSSGATSLFGNGGVGVAGGNVGDITRIGGSGANASATGSGGGGSSAGSGGGTPIDGNAASGVSSGVAVTGGGGAGGAGVITAAVGNAGLNPGGGGSGGQISNANIKVGGSGGAGKVQLTYTFVEPTTQSSSIIFTGVGSEGLTIGWTVGNGTNHVVFVKEGTGSITAPTDGSAYSASTNWTSKGSQLGNSGYYCVYNGTGNSVTLSSLSPTTTYYVYVYEFNGTGNNTNYETTGVTANQITNAATTPIITISGIVNPFADTYQSETSTEKTYTVSGANLTSDITLTPPANFEISTTSGIGFVANPSTLTLTNISGTVNETTIYTRFKPTLAQSYSANIVHTSTGALQKDLAVSGTGLNVSPTVSITSPLTGMTTAIGGSIVLKAIATPKSTRTITGVVFKDGVDVISGTVSQTGNEYSITYSSFPSGVRSITAEATDNLASSTISSAISVKGVTNYTGNKYAQGAITWSNGPWYDAVTGGNEVTSPKAGDNVFTQGYAISIQTDATCDNLTYTNVVGQIGIAAGETLTVRGKIDCTVAGTVDAYSTMNATGTLKLTGEALTSPYVLITDNAIKGSKPNNLVIQPVNSLPTYQFGVATGNSVTYTHGTGTISIKSGKVLFKPVVWTGTAGTNSLTIEEGATVTFEQTVKGNTANNSLTPTITINGICNANGAFNASTLTLGSNGYLKTIRPQLVNEMWWTTTTGGVVGYPNTLTFDNSSTIEFGYSGNQNIYGAVNSTLTVPYGKLVISGSGIKTVVNNTSVAGVIEIGVGSTLSIPTGIILTCNGGLINRGTLTNSGTLTNNGFTLNLLPGAVTNLSYLPDNGPSDGATVSISASNLTPGSGDVTITGSTNFEVSTDNTTFSSSITIPYTSSLLNSTNFFVRLKSGLSIGNYSENITISGGGLSNATLACTGAVAVKYSWNGSISTDWQVADNWTPARIPAASDMISFDSGSVMTVTNVPTQTISQLQVTNNTNVELQASADAVLTVSGSKGTDVDIEAGSTLKLGGATGATAYKIKIALAASSTATIAGTLIFTNSADAGVGVNHQLTTPTNGAIHFVSGSAFTQGPNFKDYAFGTAPNGGVVFESGSILNHISGLVPFGGVQSVNIISLASGSLYNYTGSEGTVGTVVTECPASAGRTYGNFIFNSAATTSAMISGMAGTYDNLSVYGSSYTFSYSDANIIHIKRDITVGTSGIFAVGNHISNAMNIMFDGAVPQSIILNDGGSYVDGVNTVTAVNNDLTIDGSMTLNGTINVSTGKTLTIAAGKSLVLSSTAKLNIGSGAVLLVQSSGVLSNYGNINNLGTINNNGNIKMASDATSTGTLLNDGTVIGSGTFGAQQYLSSARNWYLSSPLLDANAPSGFTYYRYDELLKTWPQVSVSSALLPKMGYIVQTTTPATIDLAGSAYNNGDVTIDLTRSGTTKPGFNLVGNPYPSYLNWMNAIDVTNTGTTNLMTTIWYRTKNEVIPTSAYVFDTYNETANIGTNNNQRGMVTAFIPPMQAFWVRVNNEQSTGSLKFTNLMRSHKDISTNTFRAPMIKNSDQKVLRLQVSNGQNSDEAIILFNPNSSNGFDNFDSPKMSNDNASIPEIYTTIGNEQLVINGMSEIKFDTEIPLMFTSGEENNFTVKAVDLDNFGDIQVFLLDKVLNIETLLTTDSEYKFTSAATSDESRFGIIFKAPTVVTGIDNYSKTNISVLTNNNDQIIINYPNFTSKAIVAIYNVLGQKVVETNLNSTITVINKKLKAGIYVLKFNGQDYTTKIILN